MVLRVWEWRPQAVCEVSKEGRMGEKSAAFKDIQTKTMMMVCSHFFGTCVSTRLVSELGWRLVARLISILDLSFSLANAINL